MEDSFAGTLALSVALLEADGCSKEEKPRGRRLSLALCPGKGLDYCRTLLFLKTVTSDKARLPQFFFCMVLLSTLILCHVVTPPTVTSPGNEQENYESWISSLCYELKLNHLSCFECWDLQNL